MKKISIVIVISSIVVISLAALGFYLHQEDKAVMRLKPGLVEFQNKLISESQSRSYY